MIESLPPALLKEVFASITPPSRLFKILRVGGIYRLNDCNRRSILTRILTAIFMLMTLFHSSLIHADDPIFTPETLPEAEKTYALVTGDFNADGAIDFVAGNNDQANRIYWNNGAGNFSSTLLPGPADDTRAVAVGDLNGDGTLDLIIGNDGEANRIYFNDGVGNFSTFVPFGPATITDALAIGDVDGDGTLDIVDGRLEQQNLIYLNDGQGGFGMGKPFGTTDWTRSIALGDVDGDGTLDIVEGNRTISATQNYVYLNDGAGNFSNATPLGTADLTYGVQLADLNGDGTLDIIISNVLEANRFYLNNGSGGFGTGVAFGSSPNLTFGLAVGDLNGDGAIDIVEGNADSTSSTVRVNLNDGQGMFPVAYWLDGTNLTQAIALADLDNNGALDVIIGNAEGDSGTLNRIYFSDSGGIFTKENLLSQSPPRDTNAAAVGDLNGDGRLDIALARTDQNLLFYQDTNGNFGIDSFPDCCSETTDVALADLNGDQALEIIFSNIDDDNYIDGISAGNIGATTSIAVGDLNGDDALDIVFGNRAGSQNTIFFNNGAGLFSTSRLFGGQNDTEDIALGDMNGDGTLDIVVGNNGQSGYVYFNDGTGTLDANVVFGGQENTRSVAVADLDGDGDLDIVNGNDQQENKIYRNLGAGTFDSGTSFGGLYRTYSVALGDLNGNGHIDIVDTGNSSNDSFIYLNDGKGNFGAPIFYPSDTSLDQLRGEDVTLADMNGDGMLDIIMANGQTDADHIHWNGIQALSNDTPISPFKFTPRPRVTVTRPIPTANADFYSTPYLIDSPIIPFTYTVFDSTSHQIGRIEAQYSPNGGGQWFQAVATEDTVISNLSLDTSGVATSTFIWNAFASGFFGKSDNVVFRLEAHPLVSTATLTGTFRYTDTTPGPYQWPYASATTFPFRVQSTPLRVISGTIPISNAIVYRLPAGQSEGGTLLTDDQGAPLRTNANGYLIGSVEAAVGDKFMALAPIYNGLNYEGHLSFDGVDDTVVSDSLGAAIGGEISIAFWTRTTATNGILLALLGTTANDQFIISNASNLAIRRGGNSVNTGISVNNDEWHYLAVTWRSSDGRVQLYRNGDLEYTGTLAGSDFPADSLLYLGQDANTNDYFQGDLDDIQLWTTVRNQTEIALGLDGGISGNEADLRLYWPVNDNLTQVVVDQTPNQHNGNIEGATWQGDSLGGYTVYHTNATPTKDGVDLAATPSADAQTLLVSARHPLILFDLNVSVEWDMTNDVSYRTQLETNLREVSEHLYDFTNGQAALGKVTISQAADNWVFANIVVHATNRLRPFASQGGLVPQPETDPQNGDVVYQTGQVHMGSNWTRYGNSDPNFAQDWSLVLAHELGHYLFYLDDTYLGLNDDGLLIAVDTINPTTGCIGSAMGDVYASYNSEFLPAGEHWNAKCDQSLLQQTLERNEWETMKLFYPWLNAPPDQNATPSTNPADDNGPIRLPFEVTTISLQDPITPAIILPIADQTFFLDDVNGASLFAPRGHAFLVRDDKYIIPLGKPKTSKSDEIIARGGQYGDRLCFFEPSTQHYGCETIANTNITPDRLTIEKDETWTPIIQLTPVNTMTFDVAVSGLPANLPMQAQLYPEFGEATPAIQMTISNGQYQTRFELPDPGLTGYVQVWVDEAATETNPRREMITIYSVGGNPGASRGGTGYAHLRGGGGASRGGTGYGPLRGFSGSGRSGNAPVTSPDGQMIFFTENPLTFQPGELYTIQIMAALPPVPTGTVIIGQGYNLVASPEADASLPGSISFQYSGTDALIEGITETAEAQLTVHFWDGTMWLPIPTVRNTVYNFASARSHGSGIYALLSSGSFTGDLYLPIITK